MKVNELFEAAEKKARYKISWKGYHNNPKPEIHGIDHFCDDNGFTKEDIADIKDLHVGEEWSDGGPFDSIKVVRLTDGILKEAQKLPEGKDMGYDEDRKVVLGDVKVWLNAMNVDAALLADIIHQAKESPEYGFLTDVVKDISTAREQKNGTFTFEHPGATNSSETRYHVYANGQIRMSSLSGDNERTPTRLASPKPRLEPGRAEESFVGIYTNAFKELLKKANKVKRLQN